MKGQIQTGAFKGTGAAVNVSLGYIPSMVRVFNARGATEFIVDWPGLPILGFDSGSTEIRPGDVLADASAGGSFTVASITLTSGTWAGGDAAGWMEIIGEAGTITNNNALNLRAGENRAAVSDVATIDGSVNYFDIDTDTEVGTPASRAVTAYLGTTTAAKGFTIAAGFSVSGEWTRWVAIGPDI